MCVSRRDTLVRSTPKNVYVGTCGLAKHSCYYSYLLTKKQICHLAQITSFLTKAFNFKKWYESFIKSRDSTSLTTSFNFDNQIFSQIRVLLLLRC